MSWLIDSLLAGWLLSLMSGPLGLFDHVPAVAYCGAIENTGNLI